MKCRIISSQEVLLSFLKKEDSSAYRIVVVDLPLSQPTRQRILSRSCDISGDLDKDRFDRDYIEFVSSLSTQYHSKWWWANSLSEKNELISPFYQRLFYFCRIKDIIASLKKEEPFLVLTQDIVLIQQLCADEALDGQLESELVSLSWLRRRIINKIRLVVKMIMMMAQEFLRIILNRIYLKKVRIKIDPSRSCRLVRTIVDQRSYKSGAYQDSYFGRLIEFLKKDSKSVVFWATIVQDYHNNLKKIAKGGDLLLVSLETFLNPRDLWSVAFESLRKRIFLKEKVFIKQHDVTILVQEELDNCFYGAKFFDNLLYAKKTACLLKELKVDEYIYPFENYAWEKMTLWAIKESSLKIKTTGFQHAFISKNSFRYFPGKSEQYLIPLPDRIVTLGEATQDILNEFGSYGLTKIVTGCALRQDKTLTMQSCSQSVSRNILVPLTITIEDSLKVLYFLVQAGLGDYQGQIFLRFHPLTPKEEVLKQFTVPWPSNFVVSASSLVEDFKQTGVVLYTWTTVSLEALMVGLPVIYLDVNQPLNVDPLFKMTSLKRVSSRPDQLKDLINDLLSLNNKQYAKELKTAQEYVQRYFFSINEDQMKVFLSNQ